MALFLFIPFGAGSSPPSPVAPLTTPLELYVAPADADFPGNNTNNGTTPETPVLTLAGAYSKIPTFLLAAAVIIHVATYPGMVWTPIPDYSSYTTDGQIILICDGAGQPGDDGRNVLVSGVAGAGTTDTFVDYPGTPGTFNGYMLEITSGAFPGQRQLIRNNTSDGLIPDVELAIAPGDTFDIFVGGAEVALVGNTPFAAGSQINTSVVNFAFLGAGGNAGLHIENMNLVKLMGCIWGNEAKLSIHESNVFGGTLLSVNSFPFDLKRTEFISALAAATPASNALLWNGWGVSTTDIFTNGATQTFDTFIGFLVSAGPFILASAFSGINMVLFGGGFTSGAFVQNGTRLEFIASGGAVPFLLQHTDATPYALSAKNIDLVKIVSSDLSVEFNDFNADLDGGGYLHIENSKFEWSGDYGLAGPLRVINGTGFTFLNSNGSMTIPTAVLMDITDGVGMTTQDGSSMVCYSVAASEVTGTLVFYFTDENSASTIGIINRNSQFITSHGSNDLALNVDIFGANTAEGAGPNHELLATYDQGMSKVARVTDSNTIVSLVTINQGTLWCDGLLTTADVEGDYNLLQSVSVGQSRSFISGALSLVGDGLIVSVVGSAVELIASTYTQTAESGQPSPGIVVDVGGSANLAIDSASFLTDVAPNSVTRGGRLHCLGNDWSSNQGLLEADSNAEIQLALSFLTTGGPDAVKLSLGATCVIQAVFDAPELTLTNPDGNGINCSGGGHCTFQIRPTFDCPAGSEVVVGPGVLEASSFLLAMPNPGDSFSNAGAGSSMTTLT